MQYELQTYFSRWWVLPPAIMVALVVVALVYYRRMLLTMTTLSFLAAILTVVSWRHSCDISLGWGSRMGPMGTPGCIGGMGVYARGGAVCINLEQNEMIKSYWAWYEDLHLDAKIGPRDTHYPLWNDKFSVTRSEFLQQTLGFQVCWASKVPWHGVGGIAAISKYSVTVPHWFVIVLCLPFPAVWLRRRLRLRYRLRRGLCLKCGYDLRATVAGGKCQECGTPVPEAHKPTVAAGGSDAAKAEATKSPTA